MRRDLCGWPVIDVVCGFCGRIVSSDSLFGIKVEDNKIIKCCGSEVCIEKFIDDKLKEIWP
jgi:hypothetical protein